MAHCTYAPFSLLRQRRLSEPIVEPDFAESRAAGRNQRPLAEFRPEVPRVRVDDDLARVVGGGEASTDEFVESELLRTGHFNRAVHRRARGDAANRLDDIV